MSPAQVVELSGEEQPRLLRELLDGLAVLRHVKKSGTDTEVVLLTGQGSIDDAVAAMKEGATRP